MEKTRCFGDDDETMARYHDKEWGVPVRHPQALFEHLTLDIFQAGLSWRLILHRREGFRKAFHQFDPAAIAGFDGNDIERLLDDERIVRNRQKIEATINNARRYLDIEADEGFSSFLWSFVDHKTLKGPRAETFAELPTQSPESEAMAAGLKERGLQFVGPTICYAFMQAVGMVDDHLVGCFKYSGRP